MLDIRSTGAKIAPEGNGRTVGLGVVREAVAEALRTAGKPVAIQAIEIAVWVTVAALVGCGQSVMSLRLC